MMGSKLAPPNEFRRLHPVSMIYFIVRGMKALYGFLPLIPVVALSAPSLFGEHISRIGITAVLISIVLLCLILVGWLHWQRFVYRIDANAIYIEHGVWVKNKLWITKERVQSIDTKVSLYDRPFGLVRLQMKTAGGEKSEAVLSSISQEEALRIRAALGFAGRAAAPGMHQPALGEEAVAAGGALATEPLAPSREAVRNLSFRELLINSTSSDKFAWVLAVAIGGVGKLWDNWLKRTDATHYVHDWLGPLWVVWAVGLLVVVSWLLAVAFTFVTDYGFELKRQDGKLIITKGFLEQKQITLVPERIQAVQVISHALRRPFGLASIRIIVAGGSKEEDKTAVVFPLIKLEDVPGFLEQFLPAFRCESQWAKLERSAWRSYVLWPALIGLAAALPLIAWVPWPYGGLALALPVILGLLGQWAFGQVGWAYRSGQLALRYGLFSQQMVFIPKRRLQWYRSSQTFWQQRRGIATLQVAAASGKGGKRFSLKHAPETQVSALLDAISSRKPSDFTPPFPNA